MEPAADQARLPMLWEDDDDDAFSSFSGSARMIVIVSFVTKTFNTAGRKMHGQLQKSREALPIAPSHQGQDQAGHQETAPSVPEGERVVGQMMMMMMHFQAFQALQK